MGSKNAGLISLSPRSWVHISECYLASPAVVAASAIAGRITGPSDIWSDHVSYGVIIFFFPLRSIQVGRVDDDEEEGTQIKTEIMDGFPRQINVAPIIFCSSDC